MQVSGKILVRCALVGLLFSGSAYLFKHASFPVLLAVFLIPVAVGLMLAGVVVLSPGRGQSETEAKRP